MIQIIPDLLFLQQQQQVKQLLFNRLHSIITYDWSAKTMKDKTIAIALWTAFAFVIATIVITWATSYIGDTEDVVNEQRSVIQDY